MRSSVLPLRHRPLRPRIACEFARQLKPYRRPLSTKASDPLRILFCGSDEFSCASLERLAHEHGLGTRGGGDGSRLIESIDVVVRPGKRVGRGLKQIREVPIKGLAEKLGLPVHERDTFTGWTPATPFNLIVAVSFGLFVPKRLLGAAKYGGLNVHPSLLPDLRGPAPLHHALLARHSHTGISVQTLDEKAFDNGIVLAQTPRPGIMIPPDCTSPEALLTLLAPVGAQMLVRTLRDGLHVPPYAHAGWVPGEAERTHLVHAHKLGPADRMLSWHVPAEALVRRSEVLGSLWGVVETPDGRRMRIIVGDLQVVEQVDVETRYAKCADMVWTAHGSGAEPARVAAMRFDKVSGREKTQSVYFNMPQGPDALRVGRIKIEGMSETTAMIAMRRLYGEQAWSG